MSELCTDNRFELIEKYKQKLIDATNIETAPDEMAVIDNILFRFWQMRWLDKLDAIEELMRRCEQFQYMPLPAWIPVTERLPSKNDRYLTVSIEPWFGTTIVDTMRWSGVWMLDGRQTEATVTHWMPLPEPPKEE